MKALLCLVLGHRTIRTITNVRWDASNLFDIRGEILGIKIHCTRCGRDLTPTKN